MRFQYVTPHQFEPLAPFVDTLTIRTFCQQALDVAVPLGASDFISAQLMDEVMGRLSGRSSFLDAGANVFCDGTESALSTLLKNVEPTWPHPIRGVVWLSDRMWSTELTIMSEPIPCLCIDWWQWFTHRIPADRQIDAWMYLAMSNPNYRSSPERKNLGLDDSVCDSMAEQGQHLVAAFTEWITTSISDLWQSDLFKKPE